MLRLEIKYIDYYMLRAWYRFYSRVFNTISRTSESSSEWAVWYWKLANKNDIRLLTCNNLFITYYMLKKNQATKLKYKKALIKLQSNSSRHSNSSRQIWRQASAKIWRATRLVQPNYYNLFDWTIQTREVIWYHFTQWNDIISLHGYHFYSRLYHIDNHT